ncbi:MAG: molybdopterin dinucleotide binding domain-containing protein [Myxococcales bacterium]
MQRVREDAFFQTGQRNIRVLRRESPLPKLFLHPKDAAREGISDGDWAALETEFGHVTAEHFSATFLENR